MVALIPYKPLRPYTTYRVRFTGTRNGAPWSKEWSFTTGPPRLSTTEMSYEGSKVTVQGTGFRAGTRVWLGGRPVQNLHVTATTLSFNPPAGYNGEIATLVVLTPEGDRHPARRPGWAAWRRPGPIPSSTSRRTPGSI